jgi:hypothetical protein
MDTIDTRIPSELVAGAIAEDAKRPVWLLIDPRCGKRVAWESIREVTERMRHRVSRGDVLDDLVGHLNDELERHNIVTVHTSRPHPNFGEETNYV